MNIGETGPVLFPFTPIQPSSQTKPSAPPEETSDTGPTDRVDISETAQFYARTITETGHGDCADCKDGTCTTCGDQNDKDALKQGELSEEEQIQVDELKERDAEVRAHELAHARVGGALAGAPSYTYQAGPDGKKYAIGGEVQIDVAPVEGDPKATIDKMQIVQAAALAPAEPSGQDKKVAAQAAAQQRAAQSELMAQKRDELERKDEGETQSLETDEKPTNNVSTPDDETKDPNGVLTFSLIEPNTDHRSKDDTEDEDLNALIRQHVETAASAYQAVAGFA